VAAYALALFALYLALAFGARTVLQLRRTGSSGFNGISGRPGSAEWVGGVLFVFAFGLGLAAPVLDLLGIIEPIASLGGLPLCILGFAMFGLGFAGMPIAQLAMGDSWRIGVDESERTDLVTAGLFAVVRNPIFAAMISTSLGLTLLVPNVVALVAFLVLVTALELQVRLVEESYLIRTHGERYLLYVSRVGRFVPGVGKLKAHSESSWPS
jgi:protein-S-isoprenylcysteine O-methyltransferase Ste14